MDKASEKSTVEVLKKIKAIEKEILELKLFVLKDLSPSGKKLVSLKGILKGVEITEADIENAKQSLYSNLQI
jgi:hypothetical protein